MLIFIFASGFLIYILISVIFTVIQGTGRVSDTDQKNLSAFTEFQSFNYKTIAGDTWYTFAHPYAFSTLGVLTQGVILDSSAVVGLRHVAWDIADRISRQTEVRAFADGTVIAVKNNMLMNTTRRWRFCDESENGICWYVVTKPADVQYGCGNEIDIQNADSLQTQYCHLAELPSFQTGDPITVGEVIGYQGSTGWATGKHLHFALWRNGQPIDPSYAFRQTSLENWGDEN
ncbi:MAG: Membrane protein [Candidatus Magasanikbacteria bacterium GW2011_GWC2_37_14]|uniref:Membrane protein n=1 Tax=Candidatus Magasanikbacteria bacterium GW2011_GWC2_37_14 TaxID=1619046 RepID=A0A0G0GBB2_9BACT|nr:MAG: Membrane protein [Candidatus Magasanikbacteria bacterium GW2011_GWC2_37_14]